MRQLAIRKANPKLYKKIILIYPNINEIWLFGSRANNSFEPKDWDFLVFTDNYKIYEQYENNKKLHKGNIDIFIQYSKNKFKKPWGTHKKVLDINEMNWQIISEHKAEYESLIESKDQIILTKFIAIKIWPTK